MDVLSSPPPRAERDRHAKRARVEVDVREFEEKLDRQASALTANTYFRHLLEMPMTNEAEAQHILFCYLQCVLHQQGNACTLSVNAEKDDMDILIREGGKTVAVVVEVKLVDESAARTQTASHQSAISYGKLQTVSQMLTHDCDTGVLLVAHPAEKAVFDVHFYYTHSVKVAHGSVYELKEGVQQFKALEMPAFFKRLAKPEDTCTDTVNLRSDWDAVDATKHSILEKRIEKGAKPHLQQLWASLLAPPTG